MSFETTMKFLIQASMNLEVDNNKSISSQIVLGRVPKVGTGVFDLRHQIAWYFKIYILKLLFYSKIVIL